MEWKFTRDDSAQKVSMAGLRVSSVGRVHKRVFADFL